MSKQRFEAGLKTSFARSFHMCNDNKTTRWGNR